MDELFLVLVLFQFQWETKTKQKNILEIQLLSLNLGSAVTLKFHHTHFTFYQPVKEEDEKAICFERNAIDHIQRLTHKSFSKMHDTSASIKRNFLIKTIIPVCLRSVFIIRFQALVCLRWPFQVFCCLHVFCTQCCHPVYGNASVLSALIFCGLFFFFLLSDNVQNYFWKISMHITINFKDILVYCALCLTLC